MDWDRLQCVLAKTDKIINSGFYKSGGFSNHVTVSYRKKVVPWLRFTIDLCNPALFFLAKMLPIF